MRNTIPHHFKKFEPFPTDRSPSETRALQQVIDLGEFANSTRESVFGTNFVDSQDRRRATPPRQLRPSRDSAASTPSAASTLLCRLRATPPRRLRLPRRLLSTKRRATAALDARGLHHATAALDARGLRLSLI